METCKAECFDKKSLSAVIIGLAACTENFRDTMKQ